MVPHRCRFLPWFAARLDALLAPPLFLLLPLALASGSVGCQRDESGGLDGPDDAGSQPLPGRLVLQVAPPAQAVTAGRGFSLQVTVQAEGSLPVAAGRRALRARRVVDGAAPGDGDVLGEVELAAAPAPGDAVPLILPLSLWSDGPAGEARLELRLEPAPGAQQAGAEDTPRLELAFAVTAWPAGQEPGAGDRRLRVTLDPATGVVRQARAVQRDLQLCEEPGTTAWTIRALDPAGGEQQLAAEGSGFSFREVPADGDPATAAPGRDRGLLLRWRHPGGALVRGALLPGEREGEWGFSARIEALAGWTWLSLQYPVLSGIGGLTRRGGGPAPSTYLVLPAAGGYLLHDPGLLLPREERWYRYPDGAELPLQLLAYCRKEGEGFYLALLDDTETARQLGFFREPPPRPDRLRAGVVHLAWDRRPGAALEPGGVVTLGLLDPGEGWQGAAERYRSWALGSRFAGAGTLRQRVAAGQTPRWLVERTGLATVGLGLRQEASFAIRALHDLLQLPVSAEGEEEGEGEQEGEAVLDGGTNAVPDGGAGEDGRGSLVLHIGGWRWPARAGEGGYGARGCWSEHRIAAANLAALQQTGDPLALWLHTPYLEHGWPGWSGRSATDPGSPWSRWASDPQPEQEASIWRRICPAVVEWLRFHGERQQALVELLSPAAVYLHGPARGPFACLDPSHGHPLGEGRWALAAVREMLRSGSEQVRAARGGERLPLGSELCSEPLLSEVDFCVAHAGGGPLGMEEADPFLDLVVQRSAEKIPLFEWVYHELGPVRLDGNLKLGMALGHLFYWAAAQVALGGGIPALDYTYSSLERFPGQPAGPSAYETFVEPFDVVDPEPEPVDEAHAAFLAELARARTRLATGYLAYGRRLGEPQPVRSWPVIELGWKRYNASQGKQPGEKKVVDQGRHAVPAVVGSAWWDEMSGKVGILLVQLGEAEFTATLRLELERYPLLNGHSVRLTRRSTDDGAAEQLGELKRGEPRELELTLPSRRVVLLELAGGE